MCGSSSLRRRANRGPPFLRCTLDQMISKGKKGGGREEEGGRGE